MKGRYDMNPNTYVINASAGTGKTTRLLQDVLADLLERSTDPTAPQSIRSSLVITFTEAAAAEMRRRLETNLRFAIDYATENAHCAGGRLAKPDTEYVIGGDGGRLAQLILAGPDHARTVFSQALDDLPATQISTIDALAKRIVDRNSELLPDVEPGQQILSDEAMRHDLQRKAVETLFEQWYDESDPHHGEFLDLLEQFGGPRGDDGLRAVMFRLYDTALTKPNRLAWLQGLSEPYDFELRADQPVYGVNAELDALIDSCIADFETIYPTLQTQIETIGKKYGEQYPETHYPEDNHFLRSLSKLGDLPQRLRQGTWDELYALFRDEQVDPDKGLYHAISTTCSSKTAVLKDVFKGKVNTKSKELPPLQEAIAAVQKPLQRLLSLFTFDLADTNKLNAMLKRRLDTLVTLIGELDGRYRDEKRKLHLADFADVATWAMDILKNEDGAHAQAVDRVRSQWRYIYVDESQDDNALQNEFIRIISAEASKLTMVGDVKQSIYGFRDASPEAFQEICEHVPAEQTSQLWVNYRSNPEIITFVNAVFDGLMTKGMGKVDYRDERLHMRDGAEDAGDGGDGGVPFDRGAVELLLRRPRGKQEDDGDCGDKRASNDQLQVDMIVRRVKELHERDGYAYGDIAVLSRSATHFGDLSDRLLAAGIPVEVKGVGDFYKKPEIVVALNWLRVIDNAHRNISMVAILRTLGFTDDDLARLRLQGKGGLYGQIYATSHDGDGADVSAGSDDDTDDGIDSLRASAPEWLDDTLRDKCAMFLRMLDDLRAFAKSHPLDELLWHVYTSTRLFDYVGLLPDGKQRKANLESLAVKATTYEATQARGIRPFLDAVEAWEQDGKAGEEASTVPTKNAVHVMTIHKAKGLQWKVVILMNASGDLLSNVNKEPVPVASVKDAAGAEHGIAGIDFISARRELKLGMPQRGSVMAMVQRKSVEDELRLLYVALTRPKEKLIIAGSVAMVKKEDSSADPVTLKDIVSGMTVGTGHDSDGEHTVLAPSSMVSGATYLRWILCGLIAWNQRVDKTDGNAVEVPDEWGDIAGDGEHRVICIPQNPAAADPRTSRPDLSITVTFHAENPEPATVMTADTPGYATTRKRLNVLAGTPPVDGDDLPRVPAAVNASGARYWMANAVQVNDDSGDVEADGATDDATNGVIADSEAEHEWRRNDFALPSFMVDVSAGRGPSPAEIGTGAHNVLELFDWTGSATAAGCRTGLAEAVDALESRGLVSHAVADVLRGEDMTRDLLWFVSGGKAGVKSACPLAARIRKHPGRLFREAPFTMLIGADELKVLQEHGAGERVGSGAEAVFAQSALAGADGEEIVVRGIIDGYVVDDETRSIILFDYKTDRMHDGESADEWAQRLADDYRRQQDLYARALEQRHPGYKVTERWLVGLAGHRLIDVR